MLSGSLPSVTLKLDRVEFDFKGVHGISSSFANALISHIYGLDEGVTLGRARFVNCTPAVRSILSTALSQAMKYA